MLTFARRPPIFLLSAALGLAFGVAAGACGGGGANSNCTPGTQNCVCAGGTCYAPLACIAGFCVTPGAGETGGDGDPGDGDGDPGDGDPGDGDPGDGDPGDGDGDPQCDPGLSWCGKCVNLDENPLHCGACNNVCELGEVCISGACEYIPDCSEEPCPGFSWCDVDDLCKPGCAYDDQCNLNEVCDVGTHECECAPGYRPCGGTCVPNNGACPLDCGNGVLDVAEVCDGSALDGETCQSLGYLAGSLACDDDCQGYDESGCNNLECDGPETIAINAIDADSKFGWQQVSGWGENVQWLQHISGELDAYAEFEIDIPCTDTWHVWLRIVDYTYWDDIWVQIDADPPAMHHQDCTFDPESSQFSWRELNKAPEEAFGCTFIEDPWVQEWGPGVHTLWLGYYTSTGISKIWITNTNDLPP